MVVQKKEEHKLKKLLKAAEKTISELKNELSKLKQELSGFRSVKGQLDKGKLQQENAELRKQNSFFKSIIEKNGLSNLIGKGRGVKDKSHDAR